MIDYSILKANEAQPLAWWYDVVPTTRLADTEEIVNALETQGKFVSVITSTNTTAKAIQWLLANKDLQNVKSTVFQNILTALKTAALLNDADIAAITALGDSTMPRWQSLGCVVGPQQGDLDWVAGH